jgi:hypothetical protein
MLERHSDFHVSRVTRLFKKIGLNMFQSHRTRARKFLQLLEAHGCEIHHRVDVEIDNEHRNYLRSEVEHLNLTISDLRKQLERSNITPASRSDQARALFNSGQIDELVALKRRSKLSYATLGFSEEEIEKINDHFDNS